MIRLKALFIVLLVSVATLSGCASQSAQQQAAASENTEGDPRDPLEPLNRIAWDINWEVLDAYFWRPLTVTYVTVMPDFARTGLLNAARNVQEPANMMNNLLQGKVDQGMDSLARFVLNSTVGLFGTIDVAAHIGIERQEEEFGETMGVWGVGTGPFLMFPLIGPNDPRSFTGQVADGFVYPMAVINSNFAIARYLVSAIEARARLLDQEQQIEQAIDDYAFVKNAYFENLKFRVTDGKSAEKELEEDELDDFAEFESMLEDIEQDDDGSNQ
ncbi:VacJ family lipoprotein [Alteromonas lipolytica]